MIDAPPSYRDRMPPYSEDAEQAVLAAMLMDERAAVQAIGIISDAMFYAERHRRLFRAMATLAESGTTIDPLTLANELGRRGELDSAGGKEYIGIILDAVPDTTGIEHHAKIVREKAMLRRVIEVATEMQGEGFTASLSAQEIARGALATLLPLTVDMARDHGFRLVKDDIWPVMEQIEQRAAGVITGLLSGWSHIDAETGGFMPGELLVIGGAEGMGKSAFALNLALRIAGRPADEGGGAVGYVSAEMSRTAMIKRCLAWMGRVDGKKLRTGKLVNDDFPKLAHGAGVLSATPIYIDDQAEPQLGDVVAKCTALKAANPAIRLFVVDFLQLVRLRGTEQNRNEQLAEIAYALKGMGKHLDVVVAAPCQVNTKEIESKADQRPQAKDLQGSSGMRQAADFLALLYRPAVYEGGPDVDEGAFEAMFAKCRDASPFRAHLRWDGPTLSISDPVVVKPHPAGPRLL